LKHKLSLMSAALVTREKNSLQPIIQVLPATWWLYGLSDILCQYRSSGLVKVLF